MKKLFEYFPQNSAAYVILHARLIRVSGVLDFSGISRNPSFFEFIKIIWRIQKRKQNRKDDGCLLFNNSMELLN